MRTTSIQRNSVLGQLEAPIAKCSENPTISVKKGIRQWVRPVAGLAVLTLASVLASAKPGTGLPVPADLSVAASATTQVQKADIIDDIIDIINDIINPPKP